MSSEKPSPVLPRLRPRQPRRQPSPVLPRLRPRLSSSATLPPPAAQSMVIEEEIPSPVLTRLRPRPLPPRRQPSPVLPRRAWGPRLPSPAPPAQAPAAQSMVIEEEQPSPVLPRLRPRPLRRQPSPVLPRKRPRRPRRQPSPVLPRKRTRRQPSPRRRTRMPSPAPPAEEPADDIGIRLEGEETEEDDGEDPYFPSTYRGCKLGDLACWKKYFEQINESEGFDIKDYPGTGPLTSIFPLACYLDYRENVQLLKSHATKALEQYNAKFGTKYEVNKILKVNRGGCSDLIFYVTLTVKNGEEEYFQIKVVRHLDKSLEFPIIRPRAKKDQDI